MRGVTQHQPKTAVFQGDLYVGLGTPNKHRISLTDIVAVGEHTNENGPHLEDYWLSIILRDGRLVEIGSEDSDSSALYAQLGIALSGSVFLPGLCNQTSFASRILWPLEHLNAPLFDYEPENGEMRSNLSTVTQKLLTDGGYVR
jgi:hypothetical protein